MTALAAAHDPARGPAGRATAPAAWIRSCWSTWLSRAGRPGAFPLADPALPAALADLGLPMADSAPGPRVPGPSAEPWRPWLALAAAHLMAHGDTLAGPAPA